MASLLRQLRRESAKPKKTLIGVYGAFDRFNLLLDGDILLVFNDDADLCTFLSRSPKSLLPKIIHPMYFEDLMTGIRMGAKYSLRREVAEKFLAVWAKMYRIPPPFTAAEVAKIEDFLCLSNS
jgi:hypothetical protein